MDYSLCLNFAYLYFCKQLAMPLLLHGVFTTFKLQNIYFFAFTLGNYLCFNTGFVHKW